MQAVAEAGAPWQQAAARTAADPAWLVPLPLHLIAILLELDCGGMHMRAAVSPKPLPYLVLSGSARATLPST